MKNAFKLLFILMLFSNPISAQVDTIENEILNYRPSKSLIISKGRNLLINKLMEGDISKVKQIKDYLKRIEGDKYLSFLPEEYDIILYWTKEYDELIKNIQERNSDYLSQLFNRIPPQKDLLTFNLKEYSVKNVNKLKKQIFASDLNQDTKEFLSIYLDKILIDKRINPYAQDTVNEKAEVFIQKYPDSKYVPIVKEKVIYVIKSNEWSISQNLSGGYEVLTGNLSKNFTNPFRVGFSLNGNYKKISLFAGFHTGFMKSRKSISYSSGLVDAGKDMQIDVYEISSGYNVLNTRTFKVTPFGGMGLTSIYMLSDSLKCNNKSTKINLNNSTTYFLGVNFYIKLISKYWPKYNHNVSYPFIRIRYTYYLMGLENENQWMRGNMHYFTIGLGLMIKDFKQKSFSFKW